MKIQVISDIHLEQRKEYPKIEPLCDYLFLVGDIGKINNKLYDEFLHYCCDNWKLIYYVLGNHEFYHNNKTYDVLYEMYEKYIDTFNNIFLLDKQVCYLEEFQILGCTLWSDTCVTLNLNDFNHIKEKKNNRKHKLTIDTFKEMHKTDKNWLLENYDDEKKTIILTHFPTCRDYVENGTCANNMYSSYFTNDIKFDNLNDLICIAGHTHYGYDFISNNVRYIGNQYGYEFEPTNMNMTCLFDI
jgi:hypothetical protein